MDNPQIAEKFFEENFFHKDKLLKEYFQSKKYDKFRARVKGFKEYEKNLERTVYALVTHSIQDVLYREAAKLGKTMSPAGFLVLCGGAAINQYLPDAERTVTTDIDFKFVPSFMGVPVTSTKYFGYLQYTKLWMWDEIGKLAMGLSRNAIIKKRLKAIQNSEIGKCLKINFEKILFTRRYIILHKKKQSKNNSVKKDDVLIDVELFAVDIKQIKFFSNKYDSLSGVFDFPIMKRGELGGLVMKGTRKGITYKTITKRKIFNPHIRVANKRFLIEDIYLMKSLGLRPEKTKKDRERLEKLAKFAFKVNVNKGNSNLNVVKKATAAQVLKPSILKQTRKLPIQKISAIDPYKYEAYTTKLTPRQIARISYPLFGPKGAEIKNFSEVGNTRFMFNTKTHRWVRAPHRSYVRNTATYRMMPQPGTTWRKKTNVKINLSSKPSVYGYSMTRDRWIPSDVLSKVARIPLIGHKDLKRK